MKTNIFKSVSLSLLLSITAVPTAMGEAQKCERVAAEWIKELQSTKESILLSHARDKCRYASTWVKKIEEDSETNRDRSCRDLILIYTHKECVYFRDYLDPAAYTPCKAWTREMYQQCMEGDVNWFIE